MEMGHDASVMRTFAFEHLPTERQRQVGFQFQRLASRLCQLLAAGNVRQQALETLWDSRETALMACD